MRIMGAQEKPAELQPWAVGIGRPITEASLHALRTGFERIMPEGVALITREIPGVNYVSADNMASLVERSSASIDQSQVAPLANQIVASLCEKNKFNAAALDPVVLNIERVKFKSNSPYASHLQIRLYDRAEEFYPGGYLMDGEKTVALQTLGLQRKHRDPNRGNVSRGLLKIGLIVGELGLVTNPRLVRLGDMLEGQVELDPVGIVTST
jgi:hypothetical protein